MKVSKHFEEQVFFTTARITIPQEKGAGSSIGTGFLYKAPLNDGTKDFILLLISNKHVFTNPKGKISFNFNKKDKDNEPDLGNLHTFEAEDFSSIYTEHPNPKIDLACINAYAITKANVYFRTIASTMVSNFEEERLTPGLDVWFVGYPENRFDVTHNLPLLRKGYISSLPKIDFNSKDQVVIDAQVFQGSSGSPVFTTINGKFKLIGVVTETMIKHGKLQAVPTLKIGVGIQQNLGLGIILKATLIQEMVNEAVKKALQEKL